MSQNDQELETLSMDTDIDDIDLASDEEDLEIGSILGDELKHEEKSPEETITDAGEKQVTIAVENLSKHFKQRGEFIKAVDEVSFTFKEGQFATIMGPSGCGKSTLLYLLGSLDKPTSGSLTVDGVDVRGLSARQEHLFRRQKLGFVFQSFHLVPNLTALENVMLPMELMGGKPRAIMRDRARTLLSQVGIDEGRQQHKPGKLSGGQQQRVAIARALANDPKVILADEPTGNLDSRNGKLIIELLRRLANQGKTVVIVTHDRSIARIADVRIELEDGHIESINDGSQPLPQHPMIPPKKKGRRR